jgi:hypothetical protein
VADAGRWVGFAAGLVLVGWVGESVVVTLMTPREHHSRPIAAIGLAVRRLLMAASRRASSYETQDALLASMAPLTLLAQLGAWFGFALVGWALVAWPAVGGSFWQAFRDAAAAAFTLELAPVHRVGATLPLFGAAASGPLIVAMQIAYLPTLYSAFNRREALVTLLASRAGSPPWGPEILRRHWFFDLVDQLPRFYDEWERFAAEVLESHTSYRVLLLFRSPSAWRSWAVSLLAVLDSAALLHAVAPGQTPSQARLCLQMGLRCFQGLARAFGLPYVADPDPDETPLSLGYLEFLVGYHAVTETGIRPERTPEEAWRHFRGWRVNYELAAYAIAEFTLAPPAPWSGPRRGLARRVVLPEPLVHRMPGGGRYSEPRLGTPRSSGAAPPVQPGPHSEHPEVP